MSAKAHATHHPVATFSSREFVHDLAGVKRADRGSRTIRADWCALSRKTQSRQAHATVT